MKRRVDLHMHTVYSDGTLSCEEIVEELIKKEIKVFSVTDHETTRVIPEMKNYLNDKKLDIKYIPGVEVAVTHLGQEFHLIIYGCDDNNVELQNLLREIRQVRIDFGINVIKYIENNVLLDVSVKLSEFKKYENNPRLGGWKALNYLKELKIVSTLEEYFKLLEGYYFKQKFPDPTAVIKVAKQAGGVVFLAHPSSNQVGGLDQAVLDDFVEFGIEGIECFSPYCKSKAETDEYIHYCIKKNLYISGGSDYHGDFANRELGQPEVFMQDISDELFMKLSI